jgi:hypothetical protein
MTQSPRPTWLARAHVGLAHAFVRGVGTSCCSLVRREEGLPWEPAGRDKRKCSVCVRKLDLQARAAERAAVAKESA